jgi:hypothetical protein
MKVEDRKASIGEELGAPGPGNGCDRGAGDRVAGLQLIQLTGATGLRGGVSEVRGGEQKYRI